MLYHLIHWLTDLGFDVPAKYATSILTIAASIALNDR